MQKNVAVIFGGKSCENEISIITGTMAANLIDGEQYRVFPVYIAQSGELYTGKGLFNPENFQEEGYLRNGKPALFCQNRLCELHKNRLKPLAEIDCAINCCHGMGGEDGTVSAMLALNGIADASPDTVGSSVFMDKTLTKLVAKALNVPVLPYFRISERNYAKRGTFALRCIEERLGYPVIIKPARQGSSIGITVAENREELEKAVETGFAYDSVLLAEKYLKERREINCACYRLNGEIIVSPCEEPKTEHRFLTFGDKYFGGGKEGCSEFPANISKSSAQTVQGYTKLLYRRLNLRGIVRADFLIGEGVVYFNEMNTVPGTLAWYLFSKNLSSFRNVLYNVLQQGLRDYEKNSKKKLLKNCGVLGGVSASAKGGKVRCNL